MTYGLNRMCVCLSSHATEQGGGNVPIVVEVKAFNQVSQSAVYREDDIAVSTTVCGGSYGGAAKY